MQILEATCTAGIVSTTLGIVPSCKILGEGGSSSGYLIIDEEEFFYLPKTTPDVKSFLTQIETLCNKIGDLCDSISAITVICSAPGALSSPPDNVSDFALAKVNIGLVKSQLTTLKSTLK